MKKHLNAEGQGEYRYDYDNDILIFRIKDRDYRKSLDFDNIIVDIDTEDFIIGLRVIDASRIFRMPKSAFMKMMTFDFSASIENRVISIDISCSFDYRNRQIEKGQNFVRETIDSTISDSEVSCSV